MYKQSLVILALSIGSSAVVASDMTKAENVTRGSSLMGRMLA